MLKVNEKELCRNEWIARGVYTGLVLLIGLGFGACAAPTGEEFETTYAASSSGSSPADDMAIDTGTPIEVQAVWFDGSVVTENFVSEFARGELLTWGLCDQGARDAGSCTFWFTELRAGGAVATFFMSDSVCFGGAMWCREGYVASARHRTTFSFLEPGRVRAIQRLFVTGLISNGFLYHEEFVGSAAIKLRESDYTVVLRNAAGEVVGRPSGVLQEDSFSLSGCETDWNLAAIDGGEFASADIADTLTGSPTADAAVGTATDYLVSAAMAETGEGRLIDLPVFVTADQSALRDAMAAGTGAATIFATDLVVESWCDEGLGPFEPLPFP